MSSEFQEFDDAHCKYVSCVVIQDCSKELSWADVLFVEGLRIRTSCLCSSHFNKLKATQEQFTKQCPVMMMSLQKLLRTLVCHSTDQHHMDVIISLLVRRGVKDLVSTHLRNKTEPV